MLSRLGRGGGGGVIAKCKREAVLCQENVPETMYPLVLFYVNELAFWEEAYTLNSNKIAKLTNFNKTMYVCWTKYNISSIGNRMRANYSEKRWDEEGFSIPRTGQIVKNCPKYLNICVHVKLEHILWIFYIPTFAFDEMENYNPITTRPWPYKLFYIFSASMIIVYMSKCSLFYRLYEQERTSLNALARSPAYANVTSSCPALCSTTILVFHVSLSLYGIRSFAQG